MTTALPSPRFATDANKTGPRQGRGFRLRGRRFPRLAFEKIDLDEKGPGPESTPCRGRGRQWEGRGSTAGSKENGGEFNQPQFHRAFFLRCTASTPCGSACLRNANECEHNSRRDNCGGHSKMWPQRSCNYTGRSSHRCLINFWHLRAYGFVFFIVCTDQFP